MAKKKSKAQRRKKNERKRIKRLEKALLEKENLDQTIGILKKEVNNKKIYDQEKELGYTKERKIKKEYDKTKAIRTVDLKEDNKPLVTKKKEEKKRTVAKKEEVKSRIGDWFTNITTTIFKLNPNRKKVTNIKKKKVKDKTKNKDIVIPEERKKKREYPKNKFLKALFIIHDNLYIFFDLVLMISFVILMLALRRVDVIPMSTIKYIACMVGFLGIVAISLNKYLSGRILSVFVIAGMVGGIYYLNYTYDFINNFNSKLYEYQTYYVVAVDNGRNKSIYNINNKKVGLLKDNSTNVERVLNTKLDNIKYITYTNQEELFIDFINSKYRAIIVKENQYKYIQNNNIKPDLKTKVLYEFKVNCKKETKK